MQRKRFTEEQIILSFGACGGTHALHVYIIDDPLNLT
jgi:hypothetical protein